MNIVCRLMCSEELETFLQGRTVEKGKKGEQIYEKLIGDKLSFSPIKYEDLISNGDLAVIFSNMKNFFIAHSAKEARKRNSNVFMLVLEDDGETEFEPHLGTNYRTIDAESSKELLTTSYSIEHLKPIRLYEIDPATEMLEDIIEELRFKRERTQIDDYEPQFGFPVIVTSYEEAINDILHVFFNNNQIQQIYDKFDDLDHLEYLNEEIREEQLGRNDEVYERNLKEFYDGSNPYVEWKRRFEELKTVHSKRSVTIDAKKMMRESVEKDFAIAGGYSDIRGEIESTAKQLHEDKNNVIKNNAKDK